MRADGDGMAVGLEVHRRKARIREDASATRAGQWRIKREELTTCEMRALYLDEQTYQLWESNPREVSLK